MSTSLDERDIERDAADASRERAQPKQRASEKRGKRIANLDADEEYDGGETENDDNFRTVYDNLVNAAKVELIHTDETDKKEQILNLATLQRMVLFHLQARIIKQTGELVKRRFAENPLDHLQKDLAKYAQAVRDWEQMAKSQSESRHNRSRDPFCISTKSALAKAAMEKAELLNQKDENYEKGKLEEQVGAFRQRTRMNKDRNFRLLMERFIMALSGGIALIGPMLLMVLHRDRTTLLSTTSVATLLFAAALARFSSGAPEVIVGVVAAYTAVLVVFVGTLQ